MQTVKKLITATLFLATISSVPATRAMDTSSPDDEHKENAEERYINLYQRVREACMYNDLNQVTQLLRAGAPVNDPTRAGEVYDASLNTTSAEDESRNISESPLHIAAFNGNMQIAELLLEHNAFINATAGWKEDLPLHFACQNRQHNMVRMLLTHKASVNPPSAALNEPPLMAAAFANQLDIVQTLLEHNADTNAGDSINVTALHNAAAKGNVAMAQTLLEHKADVNAQTEHGETPLYFAVRDNKIETARLLLEHRAHVNHQQGHGSTALHRAAHEGRTGLVALLLDHDADVQLQNERKDTALSLVPDRKSAHRYDMMIKLLLAGSEPQDLAVKAIWNPHIRHVVQTAREQAEELSSLLGTVTKDNLLPELVDVVRGYTIPSWVLTGDYLPTAASESDNEDSTELRPALPQSAPDQFLLADEADVDYPRPLVYFINQIAEQLERRLAANTSEDATDANISQYNELCRQLHTEAGLHDDHLTAEQFHTVLTLFNSTLTIPQEQSAAAADPADNEKDEGTHQ